MSIELNDLSPLVPIPSIEFICDPHSDAKLIEFDSSTNFPLNHNSLLIAAERGDSKTVNLCIKSGFNVNEKVDGRTAVDLAWNNQHFEIVLELLKANSQLPRDFDVEIATEEIKEFVESKKFNIFGSNDAIKDCRSCGKHQIKILLAFAIAFPIIVWFGLRLKIPDVEPIYSCNNLTDELRLKIFESTVKFQGVNVIFGNLFGRNSTACEHLSPLEITKMLNTTGSSKPLLKIYKMVPTRTKFYIERVIKSQNPSSDINSDTYYGFDELAKLKLLLLSDKEGSGKSTFFRHIAWKLKRRFPLKWISYVDLKHYIHVLQDVPITDTNLTTVVDFLSSKIFNLTSKIEIGVFKRKFLSNDSIFLWDEVDEVSPTYFNETLRLVEIVRNLTDNRQWVANTPHLQEILQSFFNLNVHKFEKLSKQSKEEFIKKFWETKEIKELNVSSPASEVDKFASNIQNGVNIESKKLDLSENLRFFDSICETYIRNLTLSGHSVSLFEVLNNYVQQVFMETQANEIDVKSTEIKEIKESSDHKSFQKIHQHFAMASKLILSIFNIYTGDDDINCQNLEICRPQLDIKGTSDVQKFGLVYKKDGQIIFEPSIFKEFFLAQYFITSIWEPQINSPDKFEAEHRLLFLFYVIKECQELYKIVADFILSAIQASTIKTATTFSEPFRHLMLTSYSDLLTVLGDVFPKLDMATKFFKKDRKVIESLWKVNKNRTFFHEFFEALTLVDDVEQMKRILNENFNPEDRKKILEGRHQAANFLRMSWQKRGNKNSTAAFMDAVNFKCDIENLKKIKKFDKFMEFLESESFSREELLEFFKASLGTRAVRTDSDVDVFIRYAKKLLSKDDYAELSINWEPYEVY